MTPFYRINEIVKPCGPISRSKLYSDAAAGRIKLYKVGSRTIVHESSWIAYLSGEPLVHRPHVRDA